MERPSRVLRFALITSVMGLLSSGAAVSGEGGDSIIPIDRPTKLPLPYSCLVWEQPPIELDALSKTPLVCGWDEPAYAEEIPSATESSACRPADDFHCLGSMPITSIHWWGSYHEWQQEIPPLPGPDAWRITFWGNTPTDEFNPYSRPGVLLQEFEVAPGRANAEWVAFGHFPGEPSDSCFRYSVALEATEYFWPSRYEGDIFWIGIVAVYKTQKPEHVWAWQTRPAVWMDGAVEYVSQMSTTPGGLPISAIFIAPVERPDACDQKAKYDLAFALDTDPLWLKCEQPFTGLRDWRYYEDELSTAKGLGASSIAFKWQQAPDLSGSGLDVDATAGAVKTWPPQILADDYECTLSGPVTQIDLWGSWYGDVLPGNDANNVTFTLSIHADVPAFTRTSYSRPDKVLWTKTFEKGQFTVQPSTSAAQGFFSPCNDQYVGKDHKRSFEYTFRIDPSEAFVQTGTAKQPVVYWLSVQARVAQTIGSTARFGWKASASIWNDDAVWVQAEERYSGTWKKLSYPGGHPRTGERTALAFAILTSDQSTFEVIERQVADDWKCEQPTPVVAATWWGSYLGYTEQACECNTLAQPIQPDYFLLSIWSDVPVPRLSRLGSFSHPGEKLWEYKAYEYDEVWVGSDKEPEPSRAPAGREPVFRYSVRLPPDKWFTQEQGTNLYWFSVVAVYKYPKAANYPWGWTNHGHTFNDDAVAGSEVTDISGKKSWTWQPLEDQTGAGEDMSFVLFQQAQILGPPPILP